MLPLQHATTVLTRRGNLYRGHLSKRCRMCSMNGAALPPRKGCKRLICRLLRAPSRLPAYG